MVEGPGFNVFCVSHNGAVVTPREGVLEGITRRTVLDMANALQLPIEVRPLPADELRGAREVFLSSSGGGVLPVTRVDGRAIGDGTPGGTTHKLLQTYWEWHRLPQYSQAIDYTA